MRKAKEMYLDRDLNMVRKYPYYSKEKESFIIVREPGEVGDLRLVDVEKEAATMYYIFEDEEGHKLYMTNAMFKEYIREKPILFKDVDWDVYKKGYYYSLHFN